MDVDKFKAIADKWASLGAPLLGTALCVGFFGLIGIMVFIPVPRENHDALMILLGALAGAFTTVVAFYFGSSSSSRIKDETINRIMGPK